ncbi:MAG TPA: fibronectin type III domain-containing protein [Candidatus Kapabacteria bacterium]|nr:fibronectin type III domain-containing protein [Candidatus Kapabacteria bacterium]
MTQAQPILDRFADAYVVALLDHQNPGQVLSSYEQSHPELSPSLREQASSLNSLYGFLGTETFASDAEISNVYAQFALPAAAMSKAAKSKGFFARSAGIFAMPSFSYRVASVLTVALVALLLWRPWSPTSPTTPSMAPAISDTQGPTSGSSSTRSNPVASPSAPTTPAPERGAEGTDRVTTTTNTSTSTPSEETKQLKVLTSTLDLTAPKIISVTATGNGVVVAEWAPVKNASNYIIEVKTDADADFRAVTHSTRTKASVNSLPVGQTTVRIMAANGEHKGPPSSGVAIEVF